MIFTCFNEIGKVSLPHTSGVLTISLVISLQDLHTEPQYTTTDLAGHVVSLSSTLWTISNSNSGGKFAHFPCSTGSLTATSGAICDRVRFRQCFPSTPLLDTLPIPSFNSLTMLFNDISLHYNYPISFNTTTSNLENTSFPPQIKLLRSDTTITAEINTKIQNQTN